MFKAPRATLQGAWFALSMNLKPGNGPTSKAVVLTMRGKWETLSVHRFDVGFRKITFKTERRKFRSCPVQHGIETTPIQRPGCQPLVWQGTETSGQLP